MATTREFPEYIAIRETMVGIRRWYATCTEHPNWHPGSTYDGPRFLRHLIEGHLAADHDGIDRTGMPAQLVKALANIHDVTLRRQVARGARDWARREGAPVRCGPMSVKGEYEPSPTAWVREQVEAYESSGGQRGHTLLDTGLPVINHTRAETLFTRAERVDWVANDLQISAARLMGHDATWMTSKDRLRRLAVLADMVEVITGTDESSTVTTVVVSPVLGCGVLVYTLIIDPVEREEIIRYRA